MTRSELFEINQNGENSRVEFRRDTIDNRSLAKELVAFADLSGGRVFLGVEEDGRVGGLSRQDSPGRGDAATPRTYRQLEEWVMTACRDKVRPELVPDFEVLFEVEPGKDVAVVQVHRSWIVHHVWHDNHRTYYIRVGTQSREASWEELQRLSQQRGDLRVEVRPVTGSSMANLDLRRLTDYFQRVREQPVPTDEDLETWRALLVNTEILAEVDGATVATVAGILLFGTQPNRFLPQAGVDAVAYPGMEKDYAAIERATLRGPMTPLYGRRKVSETHIEHPLVENGLVEQAIHFVRRNTTVTAELEDGARRKERWDYPEEAVREAIVNALVHRDYLLSSTDIELSIYEDRLEVISPGRLPNDITPERMRTGCRAARNQLLKDIMRDYGYLEHMGMGVPRKIIKGMREHNGTEPDLIEEDERFTVRLWK